MVRRNLLIACALAALSVTPANGSPDTLAAARKTVSSASPSHKKSTPKPAQAATHPVRREAVHAKVVPAKAHTAAVKQKPGKSSPAKATSRASSAPGAKQAGGTIRQPATRAKQAEKAKTAVPPPMRGSRRSLARQNARTDAEGLERIEDEEDLKDRIARKMLVPVPVSSTLAVSASLSPDRRYCRPWTASFLTDLARAHAAQFHRPIEVSSAVRTVAYQKHLKATNGNAAAAEGGIVSPHVTGATVDIAKKGILRQELGWMRRWLLPLQKAGKIDVEEEFQQACFHITVYKSYVPPKPTRKTAKPKTIQYSNEAPAGRPTLGQ
jgi:hypothetical protein